MAAQIPEKFSDLLKQKKAFAFLATVSPDCRPQVTPVWVDAEDGLILVNSAKGRVKDRYMRQNAEVALSIMDPDNPYRHLSVRGTVKEITAAGAEQHIDRLAKKYLGLDRYPNRGPGEERIIYKIEPTSIATMG